MRFPILSAALAALCFALPTTAQKLQGMAFPGERAATTLAVFADDFSVAHMASIVHGQPIWQAEYDGMMDKLKGKMNRLGKDWWTTLMTSTELQFGGTKIPAGSYVVGLHCDEKGTFTLGLMDAGKAMKSATHPFGAQNWKPEMSLPLTLHKDSAKEVVSKMTMTFAADEATPGKGEFTLAWGKHTLTAPVMLHVAAKK
jgi:hypothetical protein